MRPCEAGTANFFVEPYGAVYPCNGLEERYWKESMGNIRTATSFDALWNSDQAQKVRGQVRTCPKNCWMVGTAAPVMKKYITHPTRWVIKNKLNSLLGKPVCIDDIPKCDVGQDPRQGDLRETPQASNVHVMKRLEVAKLSEEDLADMLRTD
jgi:radical SAM protein with 4Fe4S-binding SPASM domain